MQIRSCLTILFRLFKKENLNPLLYLQKGIFVIYSNKTHIQSEDSMNEYIFSRIEGSTIQEGAPRLLSVSIDGEALEDFSTDILEYTASIPEGRPRIPVFEAVKPLNL